MRLQSEGLGHAEIGEILAALDRRIEYKTTPIEHIVKPLPANSVDGEEVAGL